MANLKELPPRRPNERMLHLATTITNNTLRIIYIERNGKATVSEVIENLQGPDGHRITQAMIVRIEDPLRAKALVEMTKFDSTTINNMLKELGFDTEELKEEVVQQLSNFYTLPKEEQNKIIGRLQSRPPKVSSASSIRILISDY